MHAQCLLCECTSLKKMERYADTHLVACAKCNFVFSQRIPSEKELIAYYDGYGRNDYLSPLTIKRYNELLDKFEPFRKTNRLLDVGCGIGYFLEVAKDRGWEVYGTEYTDKAIEICTSKGIAMKQGKLNPLDFELASFDILTSFEVLEHINNPSEEIDNFHKLLRPGGLVYLTTPNFNSLLRYKLKEKYNVITYPEHLCYYTPKTLKKLFLGNGFKKHKIETTGISISRLRAKNGQPEVNVISENSDDEKMRKKIDQNKGLQGAKSLINWSLTRFGIGDSLKGWFIKKAK
jgi:2-polyprenyl-3-methyl-5-hydroxy-6-metoxy-1,4-benzoquinol methylase